MHKKHVKKAQVRVLSLYSQKDRHLIFSIGFATFFFGFALGGCIHAYLLFIDSPLVQGYRGSLSYVSSIFGDGIILPLVTMSITAFLLRYKAIAKEQLPLAGVLGSLVTIFFHVNQAINKLVNWTMPTPWQWNSLGMFHAFYMFVVATGICLFYLISLKVIAKEKRIPGEVFFVSGGVILFLLLLRLDYMSLDLRLLLPR